ncbi:MAG: glycoside hydrolase family 2 [Spirochaetales bacterium]|nr:glycoside hydrolase family 2 [Spirochaetales bacterium]
MSERIPLAEYPRPQMVRDSYLCLNGRWELRFLSDGDDAKPMPIMVPYSPESEYSGVNRTLQAHETMLYSRHVDFPDVDFSKERLLLHFGAVDYRAVVFIDKEPVFEHVGGYLPFSIEVFRASFDLDVSVQDPGDTKEISRGKQSSTPGGIWYPKTSGIWQTVWMEKVPINHINDIEIRPNLKGFSLKVNMSGSDCQATVSICGRDVPVKTGEETFIEIQDPHLWSPEDPYLYDFSVTAGSDRITSYVGLRTFGVGPDRDGVKRLLLNGKPYFHHGLLDQGYFKGGFYTPMSDKEFVDDISRMKAMGFNTLRKHIKVEPLRWYHHCDRLGMLVWQDMVSGGGRYRPMVISSPLVLGSFLKDDEYVKFAREDADERKVFEDECYGTVMTLFNCTSIAMWVPFNEGWGQFDSRRISENIQAIDPSRTIDHASGWHDQGIGDIRSLHVYFRPYRFRKDRLGRAVLLTEFGGYGMDTNTTAKKAFTYRRYRSREELTRAIVRLYEKQIIPAKRKGLAASIYTQVSDVEQEVNGLLTYDRSTLKVNAEEILEMSRRLLTE